jgi:hypothetical protein
MSELSVVVWPELGVVIWPEFGVAKRIKSNKKLFVRDILAVDCHRRLNEYLNEELIAFRYLYQCFNKKRSIFSYSTKKLENHGI